MEEEYAEITDALKTLPGEQDLNGAANGIFLLQETYNLNITKFASNEKSRKIWCFFRYFQNDYFL